jgi:anaerobic selenocysteine-containing dehydrogenase
VVAPLSLGNVTLARRNAPLDPIAAPGVESVERQGAVLQAGLASSPHASYGEADVADVLDGPEAESPARPLMLTGRVELDVPHVSPADGYSVRLIASRVLYDGGTAVTTVGSLAGLVVPGILRANPQDLADLGISAGDRVRLRSATTSAEVPVEPDPSLPRKVVAADFNVPLGNGTVADLIDRAFPIVDLRMESV